MAGKKITIIKTGYTYEHIAEKRMDFEDWILSGMELQRQEAQVIDVIKGEPLPEMDRVSGCIITGSPLLVTEDLSWKAPVINWVQSLANKQIPILGICFGHQFLAVTFGGIVDFNPEGLEIGTAQVCFNENCESDLLLKGIKKSDLNVTHSQSVTRLPPGAVNLAYSSMDPNQAFRIGRNIWGIQFHPEFDKEIIQAYVKVKWEMIKEQGGDPESILVNCRDTPRGSEILKNFLNIVENRQI